MVMSFRLHIEVFHDGLVACMGSTSVVSYPGDVGKYALGSTCGAGVHLVESVER